MRALKKKQKRAEKSKFKSEKRLTTFEKNDKKTQRKQLNNKFKNKNKKTFKK